jgi:EmrB/QacA subfamily drug resistance transporter
MSSTKPGDQIDRHSWAVLAVAAAGVFVVFVDATVVNIAFPALSESFPASSLADLSWVLNAYAVVFGALLVTAGRMADDRGRRRVYMLGLVIFGVGSAACGLAPTLPLLVGARVVQAIGAALLVPASLALILPEFPLSKRGMAVGLWGAVGAVAGATGPSLGAVIVEYAGWRWIFYVNLPFCAAAVLAARRVLPLQPRARTTGKIDLFGVLLVTTTFGLTSLGLVQGEYWGWTSARVLGAFALAILCLPFIVARGLKHPAPVFPVRLFSSSAFSAAAAGTLVFAMAFFANLLCNVLFLTGVAGWSVLRTAIAILPAPMVAAIAAPLAGRAADRMGYRAIVLPGAIAFALGMFWLGSHMDVEPRYASDMLPGLILGGLGIGMTMPTLSAAGVHALPPAQYGVGSAVISAARQLGAVLGIAGLVAVLGHPSPTEAVGAFHRDWTSIGIIAAASALVALGLGSKTSRDSTSAVEASDPPTSATDLTRPRTAES